MKLFSHGFFHKSMTAMMILTLLSTGFAGLTMNPADALESRKTSYRSDRLIVKFRPHVSATQKQQFLAKIHAKSLRQFRLTKAEVLQVTHEHTIPAWRHIIKSSGLVKYAEPDFKVHLGAKAKNAPGNMNDTYVKQQWALNNTGQGGGKKDADIDAPEAWELMEGGSPVVVAVIDTGVDYNHKDLAQNIWVNEAEDLNNDGKMTQDDKNGIDDDANGYVDDVLGWDFANWDWSPKDDESHGTHVSGIIAARGNNKYGVVGISGEGNVRIMPLKFMDADGGGYISDAISAIEYAADNGAQIANNSWGGLYEYDEALADAIQTFCNRGGLFLVAAGNDGLNLNNEANADYPASYGFPRMIVVGSTTRTDDLSGFSNYGSATVDIAAPGSSILSTVPGNKFDTFSGTSMATPYAVGVTALIWSQNPSLNANEVKGILLGSVRKNDKIKKRITTGGVINAQNAVIQARG